jgi:glycerophosphoryl diester phosphodiesterase
VNTVQEINSELEKIAYAQTRLFARDGSSPNAMLASLDMNGNRILNLEEPVFPSEPLRLADLNGASIAIATAESFLNNSIADALDPFKQKELLEIAHRGYRELGPQNSMLAFTLATKVGAKALECDVQITSDGVPIVYHDDTLDTLTSGTGTIASNTLAQVQAAQYTELAGTNIQSSVSIPTFEEFLQYAKRANVLIVPEIKGYRTQADISLLVDLINLYELQDRAVLQSFNFSDLEAVRLLTQEIRIGFLSGSIDPLIYEDIIDQLAVLGKAGILWSSGALISTPAIVTYAKENGLFIQAFTIRDVVLVEELLAIGVYALITDTPLGVV